MKYEAFAAVSILAILLTAECAYAVDMPVEMVISRRISIHNNSYSNGGYSATTVPSNLLSKVLWAAYGKSGVGRTCTTFSNYPVKIYVANNTATYKFVPETQSLSLWKTGDYRTLGGGYGSAAPIQLFIIFDTNVGGTSENDLLFGNAEAGCTIQNIYLMANNLNLGTVCQYIRTGISEGLDLPANEKPLYKMPLGYLISPYTNYQNLVATTRPSSSELPMIQDSSISLEVALNSVSSSHQWGSNPVTRQELSQILWAGYGYSYYLDTTSSPPKSHRTVPSAHNYYPMKVYAANSSGVYEYLPLQHNLTTIVTGDRRGSIAQASGISWASSAPLIIAVWYLVDERPYPIGGQETYVEAGLIAQNVYLESAAWGLIADWRKTNTNEEAMRTALGLTDTNLHPTSIITVGHSSSTPLQGNWYVNNVLITNVNQVISSQNTTVSFKFVKTAGPADSSITANVKESTTTLLTLANSAAGTWTGSYIFTTQWKHTLSLTASDGATTVTTSVLSDLRAPEAVDGRPSPLIYFVLAATAIAFITGIVILKQKKRKRVKTPT